MYTLRGDRQVEYGFALNHAPDTPGIALDVGSGTEAKLARKLRGWEIHAVDIRPGTAKGIHWHHGDVNDLAFPEGHFDLILNISAVEHFGVPGRYGVEELDSYADLAAMSRMHWWLAGQMILTIPVGLGGLHEPWCRVYGPVRLKHLLNGYKVVKERYWNKQGGKNVFVPCTREEAMSTKPVFYRGHYYAIGGFVLEREM